MNMHTHWAAGFLGLFILPVTAFAANLAPIVDAGLDQYILANDTGTLQGSAFDPDGDPILGWNWTVDLAPVGSSPVIEWPWEQNPEFIPDLAGQFDLSLTATDGTDTSLPDTMSVFSAQLLSPVAHFTANPTSGVVPLTVQFDGSSSVWELFDGISNVDAFGSPWDDGSFGLTYTWSFGDGHFSSAITPVHTYDTEGTYSATLTSVNNFGQSGVTTMDITVNAIPVPASVWLFGSGLLGLIGIARKKKPI